MVIFQTDMQRSLRLFSAMESKKPAEDYFTVTLLPSEQVIVEISLASQRSSTADLISKNVCEPT